jgi:hypothetical protein
LKRLVTWLVLGGLLACFAVPAYISIADGNLTGPVREQVIIWLLFAAPAFFAAWLLVNAWWNSSGQRLSTMDGPARLLAVAVGAMPETRKEWAAAMQAELTEVRGRWGRWSFAVDAARAALFPPRGSRLPIIAAAATVAMLVVATFMYVGRAMPTLQLFAVTFMVMAGFMTFLAIVRQRRIVPSPALAAIVGIAVTGCIAAIVYVLQKYPAASEALEASRAVFLALMLSGFLLLVLSPPKAMMASRRARWIGVGVGFVHGGLFLLSTGFTQFTGDGALGYVLFGPGFILFLGALFVAGIDGSFRSGIQTAVWGATVGSLLTFCIWLLESMRWIQSGAGLLIDNDHVPNLMAANIQDAIFWILIWVPVWCLPIGILGAALSGWNYRGRAVNSG